MYTCIYKRKTKLNINLEFNFKTEKLKNDKERLDLSLFSNLNSIIIMIVIKKMINLYLNKIV